MSTRWRRVVTHLALATAIALVATGCERRETTWQDVALYGVMMFGIAAVSWVSNRSRK